jgi:signal transduction histidine kinase
MRTTESGVNAAINRLLATSFSQLRTRLVLAVVLAVIPALVLTLCVGITQKHRAAEQAKREFLNVTKIAATEQERIFDGAKQLLGVLVHLPEVRSLDAALCDPLLAGLLKKNPLYANFGVVDRDGMIVCSALPFNHPVSIADRLWFQRAVKTRAFAVGDYIISRTAHLPTLNCGYPFLDGDGNILGVAFVAVDLNWESQLLAHARLPEGTAATLLDSSGNILARTVDAEKWVGKSVADKPFIKTVLAHRNEGTAECADIDGVIRLIAFTPLKESGSTIVGHLILGIPPAVAYADANRIMVRSFVFLAVAGVFAFAVAWVLSGAFVLGRTREMIEAANRLRAGDLTSRLRPDHQFGEFTGLARAFDEMAGALEQRLSELKLADEQLKQHRDHLEELVVKRTAELNKSNKQLHKSISDLQESHKELRASQALLINAEKMETVGRLAAGVAHEVKNPLAILMMSLDYLSQTLPDADGTVSDVLKDMRDAIWRADVIIRGLLDFSASEQLDLQPGDMNSVIEKAILLVKHGINLNHVKLLTNLDLELPPVVIDRNKLVQAYVNLFSNSIDAMPDGGTLIIRTYVRQSAEPGSDLVFSGAERSCADDLAVIVELEDTGGGISQDKISKIFDPFFTTKPPGKGTGLGLPVTRKIIELHGGNLEITNRQEGGVRTILRFKAMKK